MQSHEEIEHQLITTVDEFYKLSSDWNHLCESNGYTHYFQSFLWAFNVWQSVASKRKRLLYIVVGKVQNKTVLIWPLMVDGNKLRLLSSDTLEYRELIIENHKNTKYRINQTWAFIKKNTEADVFIFLNLRLPSNIYNYLPSCHKTIPSGQGVCPVIRLNEFDDWTHFTKQLSKSLVNDQRRQWKRVSELLPNINFEIVTEDNEIEKLIFWIMNHKKKWLEKVNKLATNFTSPEMLDLFIKNSMSAQNNKNLVIAKLNDGETIISAGFGYKCGKEFLFHVFTYNEEWQRLSPSRLFLEKLVCWCFDNNIETFDFMPGDEKYKYIWATDLIQTRSFIGSLSRTGWALIRLQMFRQLFTKYPYFKNTMYSLIPQPLLLFIKKKFSKTRLMNFEIKASPKLPELINNKKSS